MAFYDYLPKFNYIEPNNLKGLQPGFVVAQEERVAPELLKGDMFENGKLCALSKDGIVAASEDSRVVFIHYTEPLNTIYNSDQFFALNVKEECPRLVQLIAGDEWMSTEDLGDDILGGRVVKVTAEKGWFSVDTMANGDKGYHYMFLG
jgi:hypothetical protein